MKYIMLASPIYKKTLKISYNKFKKLKISYNKIKMDIWKDYSKNFHYQITSAINIKL